MYLKHFGLREEPFALTTDPRFLFLSPAHAHAQACLEFAVLKGDGIVVITGAIGAGKSTLAHDLAKRAAGEVVVVHNTHVGATGLLQEILTELGHGNTPSSKAELLIALRREFATRFQSGTRTLLIVDEAQHLDSETLEELRMLADEQVEHEKPMSIVLAGQPTLAATLRGAALEQVRQRIRLHFHLPPLTLIETERYLAHRLCVASRGVPSTLVDRHNPAQLFDRDAVVVIYRYTGGVPRLINVLADLGLMTAWMEEKPQVSAAMINVSVKELGWVPYRRRRGIDRRDPGVVARRPGVLATVLNWVRTQTEAATGLVTQWLTDATSLGAALFGRARSKWSVLHGRLVRGGTETGHGITHQGEAATKSDYTPRLAVWPAAAIAVALLFGVLIVPALWSDGNDAPTAATAHETPNTAVMLDGPDETPTTDAVADASGPVESRLLAMLDPTGFDVAQNLRHPAPAATDQPVSQAINDPAVERETESAGNQNVPLPIDLPSAPWLLEQSPDNYVVQVFATHQPDSLSRFAGNQKLNQMAYYYRRHEDEDWYVLVAGQYSSYEQATTASAMLPEAVRRNKPWVRKMAIVQDDIQQTAGY